MLWVGQQEKNQDIGLEGKKLKQRDSFVNLGGVVCRDDSKMEICREYKLGHVHGGKWKG